MENVRGAARAVAFGEAGDCAVVQQFDPLDGAMDAVAVADGEAWKALVLLVSWGYLLPSLLLEPLKSLVKVSDGLCILLLLLMMNSVALVDSLNELFGEVAEPDRVVDVEPLNDVSGRGWGDGVHIGNRHEDGGRGAG